MTRVLNILMLNAMSLLFMAAVIVLVWHTLDDRSTDIAVPDEAIALVKHDPNPPMMAWRPRIPDSVGTTPVVGR